MSETSKTYEENVKEQYEALGRFVEAFESMVNETREDCIELLAKDGRHRELIEVVLHHSSLTSKPLFEIFRAVIAHIIESTIAAQAEKEKGVVDLDPPLILDAHGKPWCVSTQDREAFFGATKTIADEYTDLANKRNNLLHATWFIGYRGADDPSCAEFYVRKYTAAKRGLETVELPKNAAELLGLAKRCEVTTGWITWLHDCIGGWSKLQERFQREGAKWFLVTPAGNKTTLPQR
jgi:hypothetical protein